MDLLNNPWFVGVGGGIISSLIVFVMTQYFFERQNNREYLQKIKTANGEILWAVRSLIVEGKVPTREIYRAIKLSVASKYALDPEHLYNERTLFNDLVCEVTANSFLTTEQKTDYYSLLEALRLRESDEQEDHEVITRFLKKQRGISTALLSALMSTLAFILTATVLAEYYQKDNILSLQALGREQGLWAKADIIIAAILGIVLVLFLQRNLNNDLPKAGNSTQENTRK